MKIGFGTCRLNTSNAIKRPGRVKVVARKLSSIGGGSLARQWKYKKRILQSI